MSLINENMRATGQRQKRACCSMDISEEIFVNRRSGSDVAGGMTCSSVGLHAGESHARVMSIW